MKHVKFFNQLFESVNTPDALKDLSGYKKVMDQGWKDITTPLMGKNGSFKFEHPESDLWVIIYANGYIRCQNKFSERMAPRVSPLGNSTGDILFGRAVEKIEDYNIKFKWLENYWTKKYLKQLGTPAPLIKKTLENPENVSELSKMINDLIENNPDAITPASLENLKKSGLLDPTDHTKVIMDLGGLGLF